MEDVLLRMEAITKAFYGVPAVDHCNFDLRAGEVHALVGENGAGKSTLMKVLAGVYQRDAGHIYLKGQAVEVPNPRAAQHLGISIVHQELNLMNHLTVAQNIFIGREARGEVPLFLDDQKINQQTELLFSELHLKLDPTTCVANLTVAKQQMVEIAKALSFQSSILIMDEPTAALTEAEINELFRIIRHLREQGVGIVHISHRLEELKQISDRVTVMRDARYIDTVNTAETSIDKIITMMVGRTIYESAPELPEKPSEDIVLAVRGLTREPAIKDVTFDLRKGEILGFAGLMGAGRTEVARAIFGADSFDEGEVLLHGRPVKINKPSDAVRHGIGYLSEDRKRYGLSLGMSVEDNLVMAALKKFLKIRTWIDNLSQRSAARKIVDMLNIKTPSLQQKVKFLSGGNQQKVIVGKWLVADTDILIFDEPTRGIDVGAKSEIYKLLNDLAQQGKSIIMISSELPEILRMSHRVVVVCEGRITGILDIAEATQESIMKYATMRSIIVGTNGNNQILPANGNS